MGVNRTLILSNKNDKDFKAVLNVNGDLGIIRFYNLVGKDKKYALGIRHNDDVIKIPLEINKEGYKFNLPNSFNEQDKVFCAVVDVSNAFCPEIVLSGSSNSVSQNSLIENAFVQSKPQDLSTLYEVDDNDKIDEIVDKNLKDDLNSTYYDACANCKYRQAFYETGKCLRLGEDDNSYLKNTDKNTDTRLNITNNKDTEILSQKLQASSNENFKDKVYEIKSKTLTSDVNDNYENSNSKIDDKSYEVDSDKKEQMKGDDKNLNQNSDEDFRNDNIEKEISNTTFYYQIKGQIEALFKKYEKDEILEQTVSQSKWVRVTYDKQNDNYYVLGLIYGDDGEDVEYIAYGVPSQDSQNPPDDIKDFAQWLPVNTEDWLGYWIVYQDAKDGETIEVDFD